MALSPCSLPLTLATQVWPVSQPHKYHLGQVRISVHPQPYALHPRPLTPKLHFPKYTGSSHARQSLRRAASNLLHPPTYSLLSITQFPIKVLLLVCSYFFSDCHRQPRRLFLLYDLRKCMFPQASTSFYLHQSWQQVSDCPSKDIRCT
jgi:hypothetical protein